MDATPQIWLNDFDAMAGVGTKGGAFAPDVLNYGPGVAAGNRYGALSWAASAGIVAGPGQSLDEYPFASTGQGGPKAWLRVAPVAVSEQDIQREDLRNFYRANTANFMLATPFLVVLVP